MRVDCEQSDLLTCCALIWATYGNLNKLEFRVKFEEEKKEQQIKSRKAAFIARKMLAHFLWFWIVIWFNDSVGRLANSVFYMEIDILSA